MTRDPFVTLSNSELTFAWTPTTVVFGFVVFLVTAVFSFLIWKRNHYSVSSGILELLRLLVVAIVAVTLNQPEWRESYEPDEKPVLAILRDASGSMKTSRCTRPTTHGVLERSTAARSAFMKASWLARNAGDCECAYASAEKTIKCVRP